MQRPTTRNLQLLLLPVCILAIVLSPVVAVENLSVNERQELVEANRLTETIQTQLDHGRYDDALVNAEHQLRIRKRVLGSEHRDVVESLRQMAVALWKKGQPARGESTVRDALAICDDLYGGPNDPQVAECLNILGLLLMYQGKFVESEQAYRQALAIFRKLISEENEQVASCLNNLGAVHGELRDGVTAEAFYRESLAMNRRLFGDEHVKVARGMHNLGFVLRGQGDLLRAESLLREALAIRRRLLGDDHPDVALSAHVLAEVFASKGDLAAAQSLYREALAIRRAALGNRHPQVAWNLYKLAEIQLSQGNYVEAERLAREAFSIWKEEAPDGPNVIRGLKLLGDIDFANRDYASSENRAEEALALHRRVYGRDNYALLSRLGKLCCLRSEHARAESLLTLATQEFEAVRLKASGVKTRSRWRGGAPYAVLAAERLHQGNIVSAWPAMERSSARGLVDQLVSSSLNPATKTAAHSEALSEGNVFSLRQVQAALTEEQAFVGWLDIQTPRNGRECWGYVIRPSGPVYWTEIALDNTSGRLTNIERFRERIRLAASWPVRVAATERITIEAEALYAERFAPLNSYLDDVREIIAILSPQMLGVPLEALVGPGGVHVGTRFAVSYASSATVFAWLRRRQQSRPHREAGRALLVGDPILTDTRIAQSTTARNVVQNTAVLGAAENLIVPADAAALYNVVAMRSALAGNTDALAALPRLVHSRTEINVIASLMQAPTILLGADASTERVADLASTGALTKFGIIHFATHALVDDKHPEKSALVLSHNNHRDPALAISPTEQANSALISVGDIATGWRLSADLVTLSGCRTALGTENRGEGYIGFAHAFYLAGAQSLLVSLWDVDDAATALFMERFYQNLLGSDELNTVTPMTRSRALQEAKKWLRDYEDGTGARPFEHPVYWAAFILIGDPS